MRVNAIAQSNYYQKQTNTNFKRDGFAISSVKTNSLNKDILAFGFKPDAVYDVTRRAANELTGVEKEIEKAREAERWLNNIISGCVDNSDTASPSSFEEANIVNRTF